MGFAGLQKCLSRGHTTAAKAARSDRQPTLARLIRLSAMRAAMSLSFTPTLIVILTAFLAPALASTDRKPATGNDKDLQVIDSNAAPWPSIGRVNVAGYRRTFMCSGTLIAPRIVLTAAHCLFNRFSGKPFDPRDVIFVAGVRRDDYAARLTADCFKIHAAYNPSDAPELKDLYSDVALIILTAPASLPPVPQMEGNALTVPPRQAELATAGYHRDRRFLPTFDPKCRIIGEVSGSWLTDCASKQGASGGPVFIRTDDGLQVAAVMSATAGTQTSVVVPRPQWQALLEDPSCQTEQDALLRAADAPASPQKAPSPAPLPHALELRPAIAPEARN